MSKKRKFSREFKGSVLNTISKHTDAHCIDNGPMEGFWGLMKREMYYGKKFRTKEELIKAINDFMDYYVNRRVQRKLGVMTPAEYYQAKLAA